MYRIATHELGGLEFVRRLENYSLNQMFDLLEMLDVHDTLKQLAHDKAVTEAKQNNK